MDDTVRVLAWCPGFSRRNAGMVFSAGIAALSDRSGFAA